MPPETLLRLEPFETLLRLEPPETLLWLKATKQLFRRMTRHPTLDEFFLRLLK